MGKYFLWLPFAFFLWVEILCCYTCAQRPFKLLLHHSSQKKKKRDEALCDNCKVNNKEGEGKMCRLFAVLPSKFQCTICGVPWASNSEFCSRTGHKHVRPPVPAEVARIMWLCHVGMLCSVCCRLCMLFVMGCDACRHW